MKFKTDENLAEETAELVRALGHDCETVHDEGLRGAVDARIAAVCKAEGRTLISLDLDFADIRAYPPEEYPGIIVLRPGRHWSCCNPSNWSAGYGSATKAVFG